MSKRRRQKKKVTSRNTGTVKPDKKTLERLVLSAKGDSSRFHEFNKAVENPSRILNQTRDGIAKGLSLFEEMGYDSQIFSDTETRKKKVRSLPWDIVVDSDDPKDAEQADMLKAQIAPIYNALVKEIQDAIAMGYSVTELMLEEIDNRIEINGIEGKPQHHFVFDEEWDLGMKTKEKPEGESVAENRLVVATFDMRKGNRYGRSLYSACFWPWYFKKHSILFWSTYLEKFGQPTALGKFPMGTGVEQQDAILAALQALQSDMAVIVPENFDISFLEAQRSGTAKSYKEFVDYMDRCISKVILMTTLATNEAKFGNRAQSETHEHLMNEVMEDDAIWLAGVLTKQVVWRLSAWNYNFSVKPKLVIHYESEDTSKEMAERDEVLQKQAPLPLDQYYQKYNVDSPNDDTVCVFNGMIGTYSSFFQKDAAPINPQPEKAADFAEAENTDFLTKMFTWENEMVETFWEGNTDLISTTIDIKAIRKILKKSKTPNAALVGLDKYTNSRRWKVWRDFFLAGFLMGEYSVQKQIENAAQNSNFSELDDFLDFHFGTPKEAIAYFRKKIPMTREEWQKLQTESKHFAFHVTGIQDQGVVNFIKDKMLSSITEGMGWDDFKAYAMTQDLTLDIIRRLRTTFNTNMFSALAHQNNSALLRNAERHPYWRYWAVMDGKTRDSHAALNGFVARYDDSFWSRWLPPNGFGCRCRATIATNEQYEAIGEDRRKEAKDINPDKGWESNSLDSSFNKLKEILKEKKLKSLNLNTEIRVKSNV